MRKMAKLMTVIFTIALFMTAALPMRAAASDYAANPAAVNETTGYKAYIYDWEDLLTGEEEEALVSDMMPVTQYGGAAFVTEDVSAGTSKAAAERMYRELFGTGSTLAHTTDGGVGDDTLYGTSVAVAQIALYQILNGLGQIHGLLFKTLADTTLTTVNGRADTNLRIVCLHCLSMFY